MTQVKSIEPVHLCLTKTGTYRSGQVSLCGQQQAPPGIRTKAQASSAYTRALAVAARWLLWVVWVWGWACGCVGLGSGAIKPAVLALLTALGSGGQGGGWRFGGGGGVCWRGERRRLLRLRRAGVCGPFAPCRLACLSAAFPIPMPR